MKKQKESVNGYISSIIQPIFKDFLEKTKFPKEIIKNRMSVGNIGKENKKYCFYNPHNYRLYIDFDKSNLNTNKLSKTDLTRSVETTYRLKNSTEHELSNFFKCTITIKKTQAEIRNNINSEKQYRIIISSEAKNQFYKIIRKKNKECLNVLKKFIKIYGGKTNFKILKIWCENGITNEDFIDTLPLKMRWYRKLSKKWYNEKKVEFPHPMLASNYIESQAIESKADKLFDWLNELNKNTLYMKNALDDINDSLLSKNYPKPKKYRKYGLSDEDIRKLMKMEV